MKKIIIISLILLIILSSFASAFTIINFSDGTSRGNLTFNVAPINITKGILIPFWGYVTRAVIDLEGFNIPDTYPNLTIKINNTLVYKNEILNGIVEGVDLNASVIRSCINDSNKNDSYFNDIYTDVPTYDISYDVFYNQWNAVNFTMNRTAYLSQITLGLTNTGIGATCERFDIWLHDNINTGSANQPNNILANASIFPSGVPGVRTALNFSLNSPAILTNGNIYWLVIGTNDSDCIGANHLGVGSSTVLQPLGRTQSTDKGVTWGVQTGSLPPAIVLYTSEERFKECSINFTSNTTGIVQYSNLKIDYDQFIDNCTNATFPVVSFLYYDEINKLPITAENGYDLLFTGQLPNMEISSEVNGIFSQNLNDTVCSNIDPLMQDVDWEVTGQLILKKELYTTQLYDLNEITPLTVSNSPPINQSLFLIKLNESSTITFTWLTSAYVPIDGTMLVKRCNGDGSKTLIGSIPITDGTSVANLELLNTPYSYEIITGGELFTNENSYSKCHIESETTRRFIVDTAGIDLAPVVGLYSIDCNLTKTGADTVLMSWSDNPEDSSTITGCLFANRISNLGSTPFYTNCTTENSIERTIPNTGFNYMITGKLYQNGRSIVCGEQLEFNFVQDTADTFGLMAVMGIVFLIVGMVLFFSNTGAAQVGGAGIGLISAWFLGIIAFGWVTISAMLAFLIIIIVIGRHSRKA